MKSSSYEHKMTEPIDSMELDATDIRLLEQLQRDAAMTNQDLASRAHTSPATCLRRVRRLVEAGVIERRVAILAPDTAGPSLTVIAEVTLDRQGSEHARAFEAQACAHPALQQCYRVSPGPDFVLILQAADMAAWEGVVDELFTQAANVRNVRSYFSIKRAKFEPAIDLRALAAKRGSSKKSD